jgi:hypothetical protein
MSDDLILDFERGGISPELAEIMAAGVDMIQLGDEEGYRIKLREYLNKLPPRQLSSARETLALYMKLRKK